MGRYPERDLERVGGGADQARDRYGSHLPQDQLWQGERHRLLHTLPRDGDNNSCF